MLEICVGIGLVLLFGKMLKSLLSGIITVALLLFIINTVLNFCGVTISLEQVIHAIVQMM